MLKPLSVAAFAATFALSCSPDAPPTAPAGKAADDGLLGMMEQSQEQQEKDQNQSSQSSVEDTPAQYIQFTTGGSLTKEEEELAAEAVAKWNAIIKAGPLDNLHINLSVISKDTYRPYVDPRGTATTTAFEQVRGEQVVSECSVQVISLSVYNTTYHHEINRTRQGNLWAHEIGHCLGIGLSNRWHRQVEQDGYVRNIHTNEDEPLPYYFTGPSTRTEFLRLAKGGWDLEAYPYIIPLGDPTHLKSPLFSRNYLAYDFWGNEFHKSVSSLDAALLEDLGYIVDWSMVEDTQMIGGRRHIWMQRDRTKKLVIDPEKIYDSVEMLMFPDHPMVFIKPIDHGTSLGGWGSGITRYWAKFIWDKWQTGEDFSVYHDDPTINWDNVVDWWYGKDGYFGYQDHYGKHDTIGPEQYASGKANQTIIHRDW